jgi:hypothetical protein
MILNKKIQLNVSLSELKYIQACQNIDNSIFE